jgi:hypothetical protein
LSYLSTPGPKASDQVPSFAVLWTKSSAFPYNGLVGGRISDGVEGGAIIHCDNSTNTNHPLIKIHATMNQKHFQLPLK